MMGRQTVDQSQLKRQKEAAWIERLKHSFHRFWNE
jgi:hypothetical protein